MSNFFKCFEHVIGVEGGFVDHPNDTQGATKYGITIGTLSRWRGARQSVGDVKDLTLDEAMKIYKAKYWDVWGLDLVPEYIVCLVLFDQAVNWGPGSATVKRVQRAVNETRFKSKALKVDGIWGRKTHTAIKSISDESALEFALEFILQSQIHYINLVKKNPSQMVFIKGWIKRTHHLLREIL